MKTYDLAKALNHLSRILRAGPNVEIDSVGNLSSHSANPKRVSKPKASKESGAALALLSEMAAYNKSQLIELAQDLNIPLQVRSADAVRDVLGKILKYVHENPEVRNRLVHNPSASEEGARLTRALAILLSQ
jgi:hypothetical protein